MLQCSLFGTRTGLLVNSVYFQNDCKTIYGHLPSPPPPNPPLPNGSIRARTKYQGEAAGNKSMVTKANLLKIPSLSLFGSQASFFFAHTPNPLLIIMIKL